MSHDFYTKVIGIDFGTKKTGLAVLDRDNTMAWRWKVVNTDDLIKFLLDYSNNNLGKSLETIVIGCPNNSSNNFKKKIRRLSDEIKNEIPKIKIEFVNEDYSTKFAEEIGGDDATAAVFILREWLVQQESNQTRVE